MTIDRLCSYQNCGRKAHDGKLCFYHKPGKPMKRTSRMRREAPKTQAKRQHTTVEWFKRNPPDAFGYWKCYLRISPQCLKKVDRGTLNIEHMNSKARRPDQKYDVSNLKPACSPCNELKGSLSAEEAIKKYRLTEV